MNVTELWRFPIKSMLGEQLSEVQVGPLGFEGDRRRAVIDVDSGVSLSAKRYAELLRCRCRTVGDTVRIEFADGDKLDADSSRAAEKLSALLDRRVGVQAVGDGSVVRHEFPTEIATGSGAPYLHEPGLDAYFDRAPLHLLTTATLAELGRLKPASSFVAARFRPNILVGVDLVGFVEDDWVGRTLRVASVEFEVIDRKPRCVMTTRPQGDLQKDPDVLRTVAQSNGGNAGIELRTADTSVIRVGDAVTVSS